MEIKEGRGNASNSNFWVVCFNEENGKYTAYLGFGSDMMMMASFYEITKEIFDTVGTFSDDDYKSQKLIRTGRLLYYREDSKWSMPYEKIEDENYEEWCSWYFDWKLKKK